MARALNGQGRIDQALSNSESALRIVESLRSKVGSPQLRTTYFSSKRSYYELNVDLLMHEAGTNATTVVSGSSRTSNHAAALEASERARARSLVDMLRESGIAIREGVDRDLLDREESLRQRINVVESSRVRALAAKPDPQQLAAIEKDLEGLFLEYQQVQSDIRARSPHYASLSQAETFRIDEIQKALDPDTVLLEYLLGDERSYVWAVSPSSVAGYELPPRASIEGLARQVYSRVARDTAGAARGPNRPMRRGPNRQMRRGPLWSAIKSCAARKRISARCCLAPSRLTSPTSDSSSSPTVRCCMCRSHCSTRPQQPIDR
jgi:hypothetical protein